MFTGQTKKAQCFSAPDFESNNQLMALTDFVHGNIQSFQFGAAGQEVWRNILHAVLAHIEQLDLRQTQRHAQLGYTVTEKRRRKIEKQLTSSF